MAGQLDIFFGKMQRVLILKWTIFIIIGLVDYMNDTRRSSPNYAAV